MTQNTIAPDGTPLHDIPDGMTRADVANHWNGRHGTNQWFNDRTPLPPGKPWDPSHKPKGLSPLEAPHFFGPEASAFLRPPMQALVGFVSIAGPDEITWLMNRLDIKPETVGAARDAKTGKIESPSDWAQRIIDAYTTAPTDTKTKVMEFINTVALGGFMSPRMPAQLRKLLPQVSQEARDLANRGVTMTPGQLYGKGIGFVEEQLGKLHPALKWARDRGIKEWNRVTVNDALRAAGGPELPNNVKTGRNALSWAYGQLGRMYRETLDGMSINVRRDPQFRQALQNAQALYSNVRNMWDPNPANLSHDATLILKDIIDDKILGNLSVKTEAAGQQLKHIEEILRVEAGKLERSTDYHMRHVAEILDDLRTEFKAMVTRQNPAAGARLEEIDTGYAKYKTAERAATYSTTREGVVTPGQRLQAIKARDETLGKGGFARGEAYDQAEAEAAQRILGNKLADSGTPGGMVALETALGVMGGKFAPLTTIGAVGGPMAAYSPWALKGFQKLATGSGVGFSGTGALAGARQQGWAPVSPSPAPPLLDDPTQPEPNPLERP